MAEMIDMNEERAERCRRWLIATVAAAGEYLQKNAETLIDQTELHSDVEIVIEFPADMSIPTISVTQKHAMRNAVEIWARMKDETSRD